MFVKPNPAVQPVFKHVDGKHVAVPIAVLDPHTRVAVPAGGRDVPETAYWMRRLRDGDLVLAEPPAPAPEIAPASAEPNATAATPSAADALSAQIAASKAASEARSADPAEPAHEEPGQ